MEHVLDHLGWTRTTETEKLVKAERLLRNLDPEKSIDDSEVVKLFEKISAAVAEKPSSRKAHLLAYPTEPIDKDNSAADNDNDNDAAAVDENTDTADEDTAADEEIDTVDNKGSTQPASQKPKGASLVIAIHGTCRGIGTKEAKAAFSVYFGQNSAFNLNGPLPIDVVAITQTKQCAELYALQVALELYVDTFHEPSIEKKPNGSTADTDFRAAKLIIVTDSADLVDIFNHKVWKWIKTDFMTTGNGRKKKKVVDAVAIEGTHKTMLHMQKSWGLEVKLWRVKREYNQTSEALAKEGLDIDRKTQVETEAEIKKLTEMNMKEEHIKKCKRIAEARILGALVEVNEVTHGVTGMRIKD